jgi:hypothetical protein
MEIIISDRFIEDGPGGHGAQEAGYKSVEK